MMGVEKLSYFFKIHSAFQKNDLLGNQLFPARLSSYKGEFRVLSQIECHLTPEFTNYVSCIPQTVGG
tara:strand:+ start:485 stop:685 length:201 start_codon:yes stop_codon:yes gene_type:complete